MAVPGELALDLDDANVVVVQRRNSQGLPGLIKSRKRSLEIDRFMHARSVARPSRVRGLMIGSYPYAPSITGPIGACLRVGGSRVLTTMARSFSSRGFGLLQGGPNGRVTVTRTTELSRSVVITPS